MKIIVETLSAKSATELARDSYIFIGLSIVIKENILAENRIKNNCYRESLIGKSFRSS